MVNEKKLSINETIVFNVRLGLIGIVGVIVWWFINKQLGYDNGINPDDIASIQFAMGKRGIIDKIVYILEQDPTNVPLYYIILYIWIEIFGYNVMRLRLLSQLISATTAIILGNVGLSIKNKQMGYVLALMSITSTQLAYTSYQIRSYALLILNVSVLLYCYLNRADNKLINWGYVLSLAILSYTHFFGVLVCFSFGLLDLYEIIQKKTKLLKLVNYVIYCILFIPYLVVAYINSMHMYPAFWPPVPNYLDIIDMVLRLFPLGGIGLFVYAFFMVECKNENEKKINIIILNTLITVIGISFFYSRYINPESSVWLYRYLLAVFPFTCIGVAEGIFKIGYLLSDSIASKKWKIIIVFLMTMSLLNINKLANKQDDYLSYSGDSYSKIKSYFKSVENNHTNDLVIMLYPERYFDGWLIYYTENSGTDLDFYCNDDISQLDISTYKTIYVVENTYTLSEQSKDLLLSWGYEKTDTEYEYLSIYKKN